MATTAQLATAAAHQLLDRAHANLRGLALDDYASYLRELEAEAFYLADCDFDAGLLSAEVIGELQTVLPATLTERLRDAYRGS